MEYISTKRTNHTKSKALAINDVDPDDANHWKCDACLLPIFATPFVVTVDPDGRMHEQCANKSPEKIEDHPLHPKASLVRQINNSERHCSRCKSKCGTRYYKCLDDDDDDYCGFRLDFSCALAIKIVHQSHEHELTATRGLSCSFICSACGTQHNDQPARGLRGRYFLEWGLFYVCGLCDFWIHPDCAELSNVIEVDDKVVHHEHPLLLSYEDIVESSSNRWGRSQSNACDVCREEGLGWYRCFHCNYSVHIKCVVYSDPPQSFKQVLLRDAKIPGLIHLPMADEHQSVIQSIMNSIGTIDSDNDEQSDGSKVHQHPLVINQPLLLNDDDDDDDDDARVCNACVQLISPSESFYSCSKGNEVSSSCRDFFLHICCAKLPTAITTQRCSLEKDHTLSLVSEVGEFPFHEGVYTRTLKRLLHNGFFYSCKECRVRLDVTTALMPALITHASHAKSHILCITSRTDLTCICCKTYYVQIGYECNNCNNFYIHMDCALLPDKVSHEFDRHPLNLITTSNSLHHHQQGGGGEEEEVPFCEICEEDMYIGPWFYGCKKCDNSFHVDCMPYFDYLSRIKFGFSIRVKGHGCPLACVRALSVEGYRCGHCKDEISESHGIAFECAECDYRIHGGRYCAQELLLKG